MSCGLSTSYPWRFLFASNVAAHYARLQIAHVTCMLTLVFLHSLCNSCCLREKQVFKTCSKHHLKFCYFWHMQTNVCLFHIRMIIAGKIVMFSPTAVKQALQYLLWINGVQFLLICVCVHFVKSPCTPLAFHTCVFKCNILNLLVPPQCFMVNSPLDMKAFITWFANYSPLKFFISSTLCSVN